MLMVGTGVALAASQGSPTRGGEAEVGIVSYITNQWDRVGAWVCVAGGLLVLTIGYFGVSGTLNTGEQIPYVVSGGMLGLFLLGLGAL
jgi:hypothetical protein